MESQGNRLAGATRRGESLVEEVRRKWGVNQKMFARLTGYSERAIANWESGRPRTLPVKIKMKEMDRLYDVLVPVLPRGKVLSEWLAEPNDDFGGFKPLELFERGEVDRIWEMILRERNVPSAAAPAAPSVAGEPQATGVQKVAGRAEVGRKNHKDCAAVVDAGRNK